MTFSASGKYVAVRCFDGVARAFETATGKELARFAHSGLWDEPLAFSPDEHYLALADNRTVRLFNVLSGNERLGLELGAGGSTSALAFSPTAIAFSPNGSHLAIGDEKLTRVFDTISGREVSRFTLRASVSTVAFSPDGRCVANGEGDGATQIFEMAAGKEKSTLKQDDYVRALAFSPDGSYLATAGFENAHVFEVRTGRESARLAQAGTVDTVAFSSDGRYIGTGGSDMNVRVFDAVTGREVSRAVQPGKVVLLHFDQDATRFLVAFANSDWSEVGLVRCPFRTKDLVEDVCSKLKGNFTPDEWKEHLASEPYQKTCQSLP